MWLVMMYPQFNLEFNSCVDVTDSMEVGFWGPFKCEKVIQLVIISLYSLFFRRQIKNRT